LLFLAKTKTGGADETTTNKDGRYQLRQDDSTDA
jgi:hypothetical protein